MARPVSRRQILGDPVLEGEQADRVALRGQEIGDGRRRRARVVALAVRPPSGSPSTGSCRPRDSSAGSSRPRTVSHSSGPTREEPPVEVAQVVARAVLAVLAELDREPVVGAAVDALDESFDRDPGPICRLLMRIKVCGSMSDAPRDAATSSRR